MTVDDSAAHEDRMGQLDDAMLVEKVILFGYVVAAIVGALSVLLDVGWAGLWWHPLGGVFAITVAVGLVRTVLRRLPS